jgi:hypothetical protein
MRLGKMEAEGFIEEPTGISTASQDPIETRPDERPVAQQYSPRTTPKDQPTPTA